MAWIGVDLDGTLAHWDRDRYPEIGEPLSPMLRRVKWMLHAGHEVRIFTSRVETATQTAADAVEQRLRIEDWCLRHVGRVLPVTCSKDLECIAIWDDRANRVAHNKGWPELFVIENEQAPLSLAVRCLDVPGEIWECGVYRGDTSRKLLKCFVPHGRTVRCFDTFCGRPDGCAQDQPDVGGQSRFTDADYERVCLDLIAAGASVHRGLIPATFAGLGESRIAFAYVDLDLYEGTRDALAFILPRLSPGGLVMVHDYMSGVWPGAHRAVNEAGWPVHAMGLSALLGEERP
jgi:hypothetical protein